MLDLIPSLVSARLISPPNVVPFGRSAPHYLASIPLKRFANFYHWRSTGTRKKKKEEENGTIS